MSVLPIDIRQDVKLVESIQVVPTILDIVCRSTGMGFSAIARVTSNHWVACSVNDLMGFGLKPGAELEVESTLCHEVRQSNEHVIIDNVATDAHYCNHHTASQYGFQSYISVPIQLGDGTFFGTLCAIDRNPHPLSNPETVQMFTLFADLIGKQLDSIRSLRQAQARLQDEQSLSALREEFIAVLGHDLRTPLSSLISGIDLLDVPGQDSDTAETLSLMRRSARRMADMITDVMDFARGRLGGGIDLERNADAALAPVLEQVIAELRSQYPHRDISASIDIDGPVNCDEQRIAQLVSNLLGNAIVHGDRNAPVVLAADVQGEQLNLSVVNRGDPIPEESRQYLFTPFFRSTQHKPRQGLGLGLYIASCIASAHGGDLELSSDDNQTRFTFRMPLKQQPALPGETDVPHST